MPIINITSLDHEGVSVFATLTEAQLRNRKDSERGMFIAESPKVIRVALDAGYEPLALLCERRHIGGDAKDIIERCEGIPVYTGERELLARLTGYVLTRNSCDPLNRRAVRVSMGSVFLVPWAWLDGPVSSLSPLGFRTVAMALTDNSVPIDHPALAREPRLAIVMGTEGDGLAAETIASTDYVARIPMAHGVDSLNVAAAAAVAFWELRAR